MDILSYILSKKNNGSNTGGSGGTGGSGSSNRKKLSGITFSDIN